MKKTISALTLLASALLTGAAHAATPTAFTVDVTGQGRPLILIPGLASSGEVWQGTVARLCGPKTGRACHVLTLAGFAGVAPIEGDLLAQAEQQLADYISTQKLGRPAIIGHSLGGFLALKMAIDHPAQTGKLLIVDSLPALGATQMPGATPEQLQAMSSQMQSAMPHVKTELSDFAPRLITTKINPEKIRDVIGKGGSVIRAITEETGATIDINDNGLVKIFSVVKSAGEEAKRRIALITADVEVGAIYEGRVARLMDFGAFVTILPGRDGLVHISQISDERVQNVSDKLAEGDVVRVKVLEVDKQGRIRLSMKALDQG